MFVRKIYKIGADFALLKEDQSIPGQGWNGYCKSPKAVLEFTKMHALTQVGAGIGVTLKDVVIHSNEHASAELIESFGFTVA